MTEQQEARELFAMYLAERLSICCCNDLFPDEDSEAIYGLKAGSELGTVVFACWSFLVNCPYIVTVPSVADALLNGTLPALYAANVQAHQQHNMRLRDWSPSKIQYNDNYFARQVSLGFDGIPWDLHFHSLMSKGSEGLAHVRESLRAAEPGDAEKALEELLPRLMLPAMEAKNKGNVHFTAGRFAEAAESYEHGLQGLVGTEAIPVCRSLSVTLFSNKAQAFLNMGDAPRAKSSAEMALALDARHDKSLARLVEARRIIGMIVVD